MSTRIDEDICRKCKVMVRRQPNDESFWCSCGRHWIAPFKPSDDEDLPPPLNVNAIEVPDIEKPKTDAPRGKNRRTTVYTFENRSDYLRKHKLTELDILLDDAGNEYWIKDNFYTGESKRYYLPVRFKNQRRHFPKE